ncbi:MAG: hypothetical protein IKV87_06215 [Methanobrevibacter sp.]|nr:hypothetical protein [Methanobrevibacter sp.]
MEYIWDYSKIKSKGEELAQFQGYLPHLLRYCLGPKYYVKYIKNLEEKNLLKGLEDELYYSRRITNEESWIEFVEFIETNPQFSDFIHPVNSLEGNKILEKLKNNNYKNFKYSD